MTPVPDHAHADRFEDIFDCFFDMQPDMFFLVEEDGTILDYRAPRSAPLYVPPSFFLGRKIAEVLPENVTRLFDEGVRTVLNGAGNARYEYDLPMPEGVRRFECRLSGMQASRQCVAIIRDITEAYENRQALEHAQAVTENAVRELDAYRLHLEDLVSSRTAELLAAKTAAESASHAKSIFLSNMSHEIRTPMNAILGFTHLLRRDPLTPRQDEQLRKLSGAAQHLLQIINDILDISKIEANRLRLEHIAFDPQRVLRHACELVADTAAAKHLRLEVDPDHIPGTLYGDGVRLGQVLINLLNNAVKFTEQGSVTVTGRFQDMPDGRVRLRFDIRDTGIGMSREQVSRLFREFEQADDSTTRRFGGTGLGLVISKRLVELMDGTLSCESEWGKGSCFRVEIPFLRPSENTSPLHLSALRGLRALVIDDDPDDRQALSDGLGVYGLQVEAVDNGPSGLSALERNDRMGQPFQLLLADMKMPGMDGIETLDMVHTLPLRHVPSMALVTAYGHLVPTADLERKGITTVLVKPVTHSNLYDALINLVPPVAPESPGEQGSIAQALALRTHTRILLVEDNRLNQEVTRSLLQSVGLSCDIAENGRQAVEQVRAHPWDLVLMDVQMPVMDGLDATRVIRMLPGKAELPIIAMTDGAGRSDAHAEDDTAPLPAEVARLEGLDLQAGLFTLQGNKATHTRLLRLYARTHTEDADRIGRLLAAHDWQGARRAAHALKGVSANLGVEAVRQRTARLEALLDGLSATAPVGFDAEDFLVTSMPLVTEINQFLDRFRQAMDTPDPLDGDDGTDARASTSAAVTDSTNGTMSPEAQRRLIGEMRERLSGFDTGTEPLLLSHRDVFVLLLGETFPAFSRLLAQFDYPEALALLDAAILRTYGQEAFP